MSDYVNDSQFFHSKPITIRRTCLQKFIVNEASAIDQVENFQSEQFNTMPWISSNRSQSKSATQVINTSAPQPVWHHAHRELHLGNKRVKHFKWLAENQERVLDAFEDNG